VEKNWVLFTDTAGREKVIYGWHDLVIGELAPGYTFHKTHAIQTPAFFKRVRGSTNGITIGNEVWFICHVVSYEDRRYYYHVFVALDATTYAVKKYTPMFTFDGCKVEYTLGFLYQPADNTYVIGHSQMDRTTEFMCVPKCAIDDMCIVCDSA
jgi:hypothetical protein